MANRRPPTKASARRTPPPRRRGRTVLAVVVGAVLGAGGVAVATMSGEHDTRPDPSVSTTTSAPVATTAPPATTTTSPTVAPTTVAPTPSEPVTSTTAPPLQVIPVTVGRDDGPERVDVVPLGSTVELRLTNPEADDEFHLHGYDLGGGVNVPAGETLTLTFVADRAGLFEVESHVTHDVILLLLVE